MRGLPPPFLTFVLVPFTETGNYTCEFCGKQYKYYTPYQEHVALHAPISEYLLQGWHLQGLWEHKDCRRDFTPGDPSTGAVGLQQAGHRSCVL